MQQGDLDRSEPADTPQTLRYGESVSNLLGPFAIVTVVLSVGGLFKLRDPAPTHDLLRSLGLPPSSRLARTLGVVEVGLGLIALLIGGKALGAVVGLTFTCFALISLRLVRTGAAASCGCFGKASSPPSMIHVATNAAAAVISIWAAVGDTGGLWVAREEVAPYAVLLFAFVGIGSWMLITVVTVLPATLDAARRGPVERQVVPFEIGRAI